MQAHKGTQGDEGYQSVAYVPLIVHLTKNPLSLDMGSVKTEIKLPSAQRRRREWDNTYKYYHVVIYTIRGIIILDI